jgi:Ran-binding protein 1
MSSTAEPTPSAEQTASSEPRLAEQETQLATHLKGDASTEEATTQPASYTDAATNVASTAAATVTATAANMKDSVFSMFGGGTKTEKKEEKEVDEPSGSSKAKKAEADDDDVCLPFPYSHRAPTSQL